MPPTIIKLGGSLLVPRDIDTSFLDRFGTLIKTRVARDERFIIITGGGYTNRQYYEAARRLSVASDDDLHWLGIQSTRLNAELVRAYFGTLAHARPVTSPDGAINWSEPILVGGGFAPGYSNDHVAVQMAERFGVRLIINISDVAAVYTGDPKADPEAKPIREIRWKEYRALFGNPEHHAPRQSIPVDAVAAAASWRLGLETFFIGSDLANLGHILNGGKEWKGTRIH